MEPVRVDKSLRDCVDAGESCWTFESVLHLTDHVTELRRSPLGGAIERVLVLVFQVGSFIA